MGGGGAGGNRHSVHAALPSTTTPLPSSISSTSSSSTLVDSPHLHHINQQSQQQNQTPLLDPRIRKLSSEPTINNAGGSNNNKEKLTLKFSVTDSGIGIPQEKQHMLFGAFSQIDHSYTKRFGGTGLGLAISQQLVKLMGGSIWVESEVNVGSTFQFSSVFDVAFSSSSSLSSSPSISAAAAASSRPLSGNYSVPSGVIHSTNNLNNFATSSSSSSSSSNIPIPPFESTMSSIKEEEEEEEDKDRDDENGGGDDGHHHHRKSSSSSSSSQLPPPPQPGRPSVATLDLAAIITAEDTATITPSSLTPRSAQSSALTGLTILVAEDNKVNQHVITRLLLKLEHNVRVVENGALALDEYQNAGNEYDLILMDVQMPIMDGVQATQKIREYELIHPHRRALPQRRNSMSASSRSRSSSDASSQKSLDDNDNFVSTLPPKNLSSDIPLQIISSIPTVPPILSSSSDPNVATTSNIITTTTPSSSSSDQSTSTQQPQSNNTSTITPSPRVMSTPRGLREGHIPIIGLSAYVGTTDRDVCMAAGMNAFATKPINLQKLQAIIEKTFSMD
eukprot:TRINITY_DN5958_c1_g1_i1.p1 TRINITY_DN5958_c1_g1~~TRINITY_DN5958_c1_g1_i1.p1  ORF type:complete len:631 (+),score=195.32 TRINITY_DN5958_c1_g1_i1:208-1893(+)